jgi:hypothetical protein
MDPSTQTQASSNDADRAALKDAVEKTYGGEAIFVCTVPVEETLDGATVWNGLVSLFALKGHPGAISCYAWSVPASEGQRERIYAVLHTTAVSSAAKAVRTSLVAEYRDKNNDLTVKK